MNDRKQYSIPIRVVCGVFGGLGIAEIFYSYLKHGEFQIGFILFAKVVALMIFLFVAVKGFSPIPEPNSNAE
ncbi:MAG: hypothetical protein ACI9FD_002844 [Gammaproteobacteria bacterium]|jgi:hypothetical protein